MRDRCILLVLLAVACTGASTSRVTSAQADAIRQEVERALRDAYDLSKPNVADRMLSLYPTRGQVISASAGRVLASRDSLEMGIRYFWNNVGSNMRDARWIWERFYVDVLSPTSAVVTATYRIPHRDPHGNPHEVAGAMTEVFEKRDGRWLVVQEHLSDLPPARLLESPSMAPHQEH